MISEILLRIFGLYCDTDKAREVPTTEKKEARTPGERVPANVQFWNGKAYRTKQTADGLEEERVTIGREAGRTPGDDWVLSLPYEKGKQKPNTDKYFFLKTYWAKGLTGPDTVNALRGKYGYKTRTVEFYFSLFSKSQERDNQKTKTEDYTHR